MPKMTRARFFLLLLGVIVLLLAGLSQTRVVISEGMLLGVGILLMAVAAYTAHKFFS